MTKRQNEVINSFNATAAMRQDLLLSHGYQMTDRLRDLVTH